MARIVFLSNVADRGIYKLGSHHLARELAVRGHDVAHISSPLSRLERVVGKDLRSRRRPWTGGPIDRAALEVFTNGPYRDEFGVLHVVPSPVLPVRWRSKSRTLEGMLARIDFKNADFVLIDQLLLAASLRDYDGCVVYRPTDDVPAGRSKNIERRVLKRANAIVACSQPVMDGLTQGNDARLPNLVLENGVESRFFVDNDKDPRRGLIYVGAIDFRFNWEIVCELADAFPLEHIRIAGPVTRPSPLPLPANVQLLGPVPYAQVPKLLASAKIGLLPFNDSPANDGRSPMKFYEYLASGLKVVAKSTSALGTRAEAPSVQLYDDNDAGVRAVRLALESPSDDIGVAYARQYEWSERAARLDNFLRDEIEDNASDLNIDGLR